MRVLVWFLPLAALVSGCSSETAAESVATVLKFSAIPDHDETLLRQKYAPVAEHLSVELGVPVEYVHATKYADAVELFKNGDVQLAWFGGLSGVQARHAVADARAIVQGAADPNFYSYFVAHVDSGIEPSEEFPVALAGKSFTFGSQGSTSGRLMPEYFIRKFTGKSPAEFLGAEPQFSGAHDATAKAVASGAVQAGAMNYKTYDRMVAKGEIDPKVCRVIWKTPDYYDYNFTAHPMLEKEYGAGFTDKLAKVLLAMDGDLVAAFDREKFIPASNEDFAAIRDLAEKLEFIRQ